jgi:hypothetical protein
VRGKSHGGVEIRNIAREPIPSVFYEITLLYLVKTSHSTDCQSSIYRFSTDKSIPVQYLFYLITLAYIIYILYLGYIS